MNAVEASPSPNRYGRNVNNAVKSLEKEDLLELLHNAIAKDVILKEKKIELKEKDAMLRFSGGDARKLLNILELVVEADADAGPVVITDEKVTERLQQNPLAYDKDGEMHYDIISAFIKSIRGSDPDGALYWLARMVEAGEDPALTAADQRFTSLIQQIE